MSSCGTTCQSHCSGSDGAQDFNESSIPIQNISIAAEPPTSNGLPAPCSKCGAEERFYSSMCAVCFRGHVFGKFKLAVTNNAMISPSDNLLVAFSGGHASRVALQFIHEMQRKAFTSWVASKSQALPVFGVGVAFVDERVASNQPSCEVDKAIEEIKLIVSDLAPVQKELHILPIESICSLGSNDGKSKLNGLLETITDTTGREDFLHYLRLLSLQKIALERGYNKLVLGSCTSAIARHIISATVKGRGYSLPADFQYIDVRWEIPVVLPLRDCLAQELSMVCHLDGLKTQKLLDRPCVGINALVSSFVTQLQDENPSRESTILRTAEKLKPFHFNKFSKNGYHDFLPSRLRSKFQNVKDDSSTKEVLCPICGSPLDKSDLQNLKKIQENYQESIDYFISQCCQSCHFQILPKNEVPLVQFYALLPQPFTQRVNINSLRDQIKDCLISDDDDLDDNS
ncbi:cytoplasmic tRNA 2-thiolation protein 2 [Dioscorea cayenensis subsp. rotundata]|uniref:Cytoplasmic tRNA 2-thiolation protein 2 n=1 Tax=Dioscorea cayennensis subsp. rotundata TaxID=55577 RepID=A0AB40AK90_DIOCR|nr:cytoplasmic tRNA 2-thiolation protein 2 [Dioscorea cayenensis subsp. rotundata]